MNTSRGGITTGMSNAERIRILRADAVSRGYCCTCRIRFPRPGVKTCDACLDIIKKVRRTTGKEAARRANAKHSAKRWRALMAEGRCGRCARRPSVAERSMCSVCLDDVAARANKSNPRKYMQTCGVCHKIGHNARRHQRPGVIP